MTIVYLYTALCTVGGADRSIIQKANYLSVKINRYVNVPDSGGYWENGRPFFL